jgi:hypothetical protein
MKPLMREAAPIADDKGYLVTKEVITQIATNNGNRQHADRTSSTNTQAIQW